MCKNNLYSYQNVLLNQLHAVVVEIEHFEEISKKELIPPESLDRVKEIIEIVKDNAARANYAVYAFNTYGVSTIKTLIKERYEELCAYEENYTEYKKAFKNDKERLKSYKAQLDNTRRDYYRWVYIEYILNMPKRKSKRKKYERENLHRLIMYIGDTNMLCGIEKENKKAIKILEKFISKE